jgi:hypothetical protein
LRSPRTKSIVLGRSLDPAGSQSFAANPWRYLRRFIIAENPLVNWSSHWRHTTGATRKNDFRGFAMDAADIYTTFSTGTSTKLGWILIA